MSDTERVDHGDAIKRHAHRVRGLADALAEHAEPITMAAFGNIEDATTAIERHADALAAELAGANARAGLQLKRAERLAQAIMGMCEGTSDDIEDELGLHPMDLRDQTADLDAAPSTTEGETQP